MASIFADSSNGLPRSQSSSNIPDLAPAEFRHPSPMTKTTDIPRAASYTCLPVFESLSYTPEKDSLRAYSSTIVSTASERPNRPNGKADGIQKINGVASQDEPSKLDRIGRRKSLVSRPKSWIQRVTGSPERKAATAQGQSQALTVPIPSISADKLKKTPGSFATFARKSWISSRSPSPSNRTSKKDQDDSTLVINGSTMPSYLSLPSPRKTSAITPKLEKSSDGSAIDPIKGPTRRSTTLFKKTKRPEREPTNVNITRSRDTSTGSLPSDREETSWDSTVIPPVPKGLIKDKLTSFGIEPPRKKDELWSAFRSLEADFQKFKSKSSALRTNVVRSTLLPFLKNYAQHPSNKNLRPEDIDRRVAILNKWWTGLLEMLDGHNNQYVSGIDRPVLLDAITCIMMRPEWRLAPSYFAPVAERSTLNSIPQSRSSTSLLPRSRSSNSLSSSASQFLAESVYHNVRNIFIQNLLSQMSTVVDKMSLRNAPASLVSFCGKAVAYAFFFCPGVAEILVRIWGLSSETIRRVVDEFGITRHTRRSARSEDIIGEFPPNLHSLGWKSLKSLRSQLRQRPDVPIGVTKIAWYGPWMARWCGRDSDLFFVFCKHYHILTEEFLPSGLPLIEKVQAPAFILVHAQILATLDATIHRQASDAVTGPLPLTFEDVLSGADASATALPLPPSSNVTRLMAENRLIMLLRDFVSEQPMEFHSARHTFAEAFSIMMRATARKTSKFDHNACFLVCDFIEEALVIYMRFQNSLEIPVEYIDWQFWLGVCQEMLESQNSMTEIRLFSFIFGAWNLVTSDERRKEVVGLDWLLSEHIFSKFFLHWCPMVRAYYMRLLCWRVCRFDGEATQLDTKILSNVSDRLKTVWSYYLWQKHAAEKEGKLLPSTAACYPAPGRRLLIIRNDNQIPTASLFLGFDGLLSPASETQPTIHKRQSSLAGLSRLDSTDYNVPESSNQRRRWSLLGKIIPFTNPDGIAQIQDIPSLTTLKPSPLEQVRHATAAARTRPTLSTQHHNSSSSSTNSDSTPTTPTHRAFSFKFSLEWTPPLHQVLPHPHNLGPNHPSSLQTKTSIPPPQNRRLSPPRLPAPAQTWLVGQIPAAANEVAPIKPANPEAKYAGRALAEWSLIVMECNNFIERRRAEGVPTLKLLEVPTLGVEGFRKLG